MVTSIANYIELLESDEASIRRRLIDEPVSEDVLLRLVNERPDLKVLVIRNKMVPESILISLLDDQDAHVRCEVAKKRKLPLASLEKLAHDSVEYVRREVVYHTKASKQVLEFLTQDEEPDIAEKAVERLRDNAYSK